MAIPYGDNLVSKNNLWNMMRDCEESKKYLPKSYIVENFYDNERLKDTHSPYKLYLLKKNTHRKQGLKLFTGELEDLYSNYNEGGYKVIQEFITNPYLVNKRIVVLRLYLIIVKKEKYHYYIHNYGKCLYTPKDFSIEGFDEKRLITDNRTPLDNRFPKNLEDFLKRENVKREDVNMPIKTLVNCFKNFISKVDDKPDNDRLTFFQIFGVDIMLDTEKNPYLLEINKSPDINNIYYKEDKEEKDNLIKDVRNLLTTENEDNLEKI